MDFIIILYYKYVPIKDPKALMKEQKELCAKLGLKGRVIIAEEGINGTLEGTRENIEKYKQDLLSKDIFADVIFKESAGTGNAFPKLSIKVRSEIVSSHFGDEDVKPWEMTGKRLSPDELYQWLQEGKDVTIVDMRNSYEYKSGQFVNSVDPGMENFRDLKDKVKDLSPLKEKTVVTVCTGGVRCEKASGYLLKKGFKDVYQLDGGIVKFMEKYPNTLFKGSLYVFDGRVTMNPKDAEKREVVGKCDICGKPSEDYVNCANLGCHRHFICCKDCRDEKGNGFCKGGCGND